MDRLTSVAAFVISALLHAGLMMWVEVGGSTTQANPAPAEAPDAWAGRGVDPLALEREDLIPIEPGTLASPAERPGDCSACPPATAASPNELPTPPRIEPDPSSRAAPASKPAKEPADPDSEPTRPTAKPPPEAGPATSGKANPGAGARNPTSGTASASASAASAAAESAPRAAYGAEGLPIGVRHLPTAFWRALPVASYRIAPFQTLPPGKLGEARFELAVDDDGKLGEPVFPSAEAEAAIPPAIRRMIDNTMILLRAGRFSLDPKALNAGTLRLRLVVEISDREPDPDADGDGHMKSLGRQGDPPRPGRPGQVGFTLNSGRHVDAWLHLEP